ncbi:MAG: hypothetical protein QMC37_04025 [Flavobacteriales bacterium]|jgi:hypothetical protein
MSHHNYISRNIFVSLLTIAFLLTSSMGVSAQEPDGLCCDPDDASINQMLTCFNTTGAETYEQNGCVEDPDCSNYNPAAGCLTIPIEDGIPFLIIAGGVFAYYRLREKKELVVTEA